MAILKLSWLGPPAVESDGRPLRLEMRKTLALLAYLSLSPQNPTRETLASLFWPEYDQQHAQASLRRNLFSLARSLPPGFLEADREMVNLRRADSLQVDVEEFRTQLAIAGRHSHSPDQSCPDCLASLENAVSFYRGDFLEGFNLKDCPKFDEWQSFQRESLRNEYAAALEKLAGYFQSQCEWEKAIRYARSWLALDPLNEPAQRMLISLYAQSGQWGLALHQYEILTELLQNELGQAPEAETLALYQSILASEAPGRVENEPELSIAPSPESLIKTKLFIPPLRKDRVARQRLLDLLDAGSQRPLTLVSAPAGFGKTTLLASWTAHTHLSVAWFSVDEGDNDPARFIAYLIAALDSVLSSGFSEQFRALTQSLRASIQPILVQLINHLATEHEPFVLILDDYQFIHSLEVHQALEFLLEKSPACMHVIISTRSDPPISLARLRVRDQLVEIRMGDLRFNAEESTGFLNQVMSLQLSNEDVFALETRTEGWIAGLQMAALAVRTVASQAIQEYHTLDSEQAISRYIQDFSGSNRYILDYLGEEVLNRRPERERRFLLQTSILERFSGPLCDAVTGMEGSQRILEELEKENLFLVPLDSERHWYRYHHLFAELLRFKLDDALSTGAETFREEIPGLEELHLRAADWLEKNKFFNEAIHHLITARKYDQAAALIEAQAHTILFTTGQTYTLLTWLDRFPAGIFRTRPRLNIIKAWTMIAKNQFPSVFEQLDATWQILQERQDAEASHLIGEIALIRGALAELSSRDVIVMREQALLAWEKLPQEDRMLRALAAWLLAGSYYWDGDARNAEKYYLQAIPLCREAGNHYFVLVSIADFSKVLCEQGRFREAYQLLTQTQQEMSAGNRSPHPRLGHLYINSSKMLLQWNRLEESENHLQRGIDLATQDITEETNYFGLSILPYLKLAQGKREEAIQLAEECLDRLESYPLPYLPSLVKSDLIPFWIRMGDRDRIEEWLGEYGLKTNGPVVYLNEGIYTALAKVLIWQRQPEEALKVLAELSAYAESKGRYGKLYYLRLHQALAYRQMNDLERALEMLEGSLRLAKSEGYIRSYVDEGKPMEELLQLGATRGIWRSAGLGIYVTHLLKYFP